MFTKAFYILELDDYVYVDALTCINNDTCGDTTTPCKDLSAGVEISKEFGSVIGDQHLRSTIVLSKSINITSDDLYQGRILSNGSLDFAFALLCADPTVTLNGVSFVNIGIFIDSYFHRERKQFEYSTFFFLRTRSLETPND